MKTQLNIYGFMEMVYAAGNIGLPVQDGVMIRGCFELNTLLALFIHCDFIRLFFSCLQALALIGFLANTSFAAVLMTYLYDKINH